MLPWPHNSRSQPPQGSVNVVLCELGVPDTSKGDRGRPPPKGAPSGSTLAPPENGGDVAATPRGGARIPAPMASAEREPVGRSLTPLADSPFTGPKRTPLASVSLDVALTGLLFCNSKELHVGLSYLHDNLCTEPGGPYTGLYLCQHFTSRPHPLDQFQHLTITVSLSPYEASLPLHLSGRLARFTDDSRHSPSLGPTLAFNSPCCAPESSSIRIPPLNHHSPDSESAHPWQQFYL